MVGRAVTSAAAAVLLATSTTDCG